MDRQYLVHLYGDRFTREWFHTYNNVRAVWNPLTTATHRAPAGPSHRANVRGTQPRATAATGLYPGRSHIREAPARRLDQQLSRDRSADPERVLSLPLITFIATYNKGLYIHLSSGLVGELLLEIVALGLDALQLKLLVGSTVLGLTPRALDVVVARLRAGKQVLTLEKVVHSTHLELELLVIIMLELFLLLLDLGGELAQVVGGAQEEVTLADLEVAGNVAGNLVDAVVNVLSPPAFNLFLIVSRVETVPT
jgi:hypothetical protein